MSVNNPILQQFITNVTNQTFTDATMAGAQWDFQGTSGECEAGKFVANSADYATTTEVLLSNLNTAGSDSAYIEQVQVGSLMRFTDTDGKTVVFTTALMKPSPDDADCTVVGLVIASGEGSWAGRYVIDFQPGTGA